MSNSESRSPAMTAFDAWFKDLYIKRGFVSSRKELMDAFLAGSALASSETERWISVEAETPPCPRGSMSLGTPVLIWPRNPDTIRGSGVDGFAYYGKRATGRPAFYLHGAELFGVTHWQPMPTGPERPEIK